MSEKKSCIICNGIFKLTEKEKIFLNNFQVTNPEECYDCRLKHKMSFWPSISRWYSRKCDATGENIVTNYSPESRFPVYKKDYFDSDKWNPEYVDLDMEKTIFEQLKILQEKNPRPHQLGEGNENCFYCDDARESKNCYLASSFLNCENIYYSYRVLNCKDSTDLVFCWDCSLCTSLVFSKNCHNVSYSLFTDESSNSMFLYDCKNVSNCFMCWNLRNKKYYIKNIKYTKEEYFKKIEKYNFGSRKEIELLQNEFNNHVKNDSYHPENFNIGCEKVSGNFLSNSKNIENGILVENSDDAVNCFRGMYNKCMDGLSILQGDNCYQIVMSAYLYNTKFASYCIRCNDSEYIDNCTDLKNCFACVGLKNKQYCILNKQYTKEEYEELLPKIKRKMYNDGNYGKFFPYSMMYTSYNNTIARIYFSETKENIEKLGGYWEDEESNGNIINIEKLPDDIIDLGENPEGINVVCELSGKKFNYIKQAIDLHKKMGLPIYQKFHINRIVELHKYLSYYKKQEGVCYISGKKINHYYPKFLGYKRIVSMEEYNKIVI